jgi:hypothetical protein
MKCDKFVHDPKLYLINVEGVQGLYCNLSEAIDAAKIKHEFRRKPAEPLEMSIYRFFDNVI